MPGITDLIARWWKQIAAVVILSLLAVGVITFMKPRQYLSVTTAVPASSVAADKGRIFNENIQALYSSLGYADDLDRIIGTANLDTVYLTVSAKFNLYDHYKIKDTAALALMKAAALLKSNTKVIKSEYGELKVKVWDTDKNLAPQLANSIMNELQGIHQHLQSAGNEAILKGLRQGLQKMQYKLDSASMPDKRSLVQAEIQQYEKLIGEYQLMVDNKPPVLITVEKAKMAIRPDRPKRLQIMMSTGVLSLLFAFLAALVMERRKFQPQ
ncbi:MAG: hypothetical protein JNM19_16960 [Chitinophagaceae bacterium]|nr:hypothetical protein [Chitinophagaceae bacterium]